MKKLLLLLGVLLLSLSVVSAVEEEVSCNESFYLTVGESVLFEEKTITHVALSSTSAVITVDNDTKIINKGSQAVVSDLLLVVERLFSRTEYEESSVELVVLCGEVIEEEEGEVIEEVSEEESTVLPVVDGLEIVSCGESFYLGVTESVVYEQNGELREIRISDLEYTPESVLLRVDDEQEMIVVRDQDGVNGVLFYVEDIFFRTEYEESSALLTILCEDNCVSQLEAAEEDLEGCTGSCEEDTTFYECYSDEQCLENEECNNGYCSSKKKAAGFFSYFYSPEDEDDFWSRLFVRD